MTQSEEELPKPKSLAKRLIEEAQEYTDYALRKAAEARQAGDDRGQKDWLMLAGISRNTAETGLLLGHGQIDYEKARQMGDSHEFPSSQNF